MNVCWGGGSRLEREVSALQGAARGLYRLRLRGQWFSGEAHYYLSAKHLWPAWPPASQRSPHPCPALGRLRGPGALEARAHPAFLGGPLKARSCWGHSAPDSRRDPHTPSPISCSGRSGGGGSRGRAAPVSLPGRVRQPPAGPVQLLTPVGHYRARICWVQRGGRAPGLFYRPVPDGRRQAPAIINPAPAALPSEDGPAPTKARQPPRSPPTLGPFPRPLPPCAGENGKAGPPGAGTADNVCLV